MPEEAAPIISNWINDTGCLFKISRSRSSKLGDYRAPFRGSPHRISVNYDLNPYSFLITTIHEFAHLQTWNKHQHRVRPHGTEWKNHFKQLMDPFLKLSIFPADIKQAILNYMENPAASSCTDLHLFRTLKAYDTAKSSALTVESLEDGHYFALKNGRSFQRIGKIRKRYKCMELSTRRIYLFNPIAEVFPLER